jgi:hypothetical protein
MILLHNNAKPWRKASPETRRMLSPELEKGKSGRKE